VNAVDHFAARIAGEAARRLAALPVHRYEGGDGRPPRRDLDVDEARAEVCARWADDLCGLLNAMTRGELAALATGVGAAGAATSPELRAALWDRGAALERGGTDVAPGLQPRPVVLGGHLVVLAPPRGMYPPAASWPRPVPPAAAPSPPDGEPETVDDLLAAASRALGVPLGARGRDKGAWGNRAAALLGVTERGDGEPDWRGDVEVKTVPVALDPGGLWRVREDPAIAMAPALAERSRSVQASAATLPRSPRGFGAVTAKLVRTLWLARADLPGRDATLVSWYLLERDAHVARLHARYLHARPKGPAGTDQRGLYLHKRFFADAGMLATLNGTP
jgi:hypothetical protein